jgi:hypothetical protein
MTDCDDVMRETRLAVQDATKAMTWALPVILAVRAWRDTPRDPRKMHESAALDHAILDAINNFDYYAAGLPDGLPGPHDDRTTR